jgi:hypothetical protein
MAHLIVSGSDLVCATHGGHALAHEAHESMPGMHPQAAAGQAGSEKCKVPVRGDCCEAMASCSMNLALVSVTPDEGRLNGSAGVIAFVAGAPSMRLTAPDPPPPKA